MHNAPLSSRSICFLGSLSATCSEGSEFLLSHRLRSKWAFARLRLHRLGLVVSKRIYNIYFFTSRTTALKGMLYQQPSAKQVVFMRPWKTLSFRGDLLLPVKLHLKMLSFCYTRLASVANCDKDSVRPCSSTLHVAPTTAYSTVKAHCASESILCA